MKSVGVFISITLFVLDQIHLARFGLASALGS